MHSFTQSAYRGYLWRCGWWWWWLLVVVLLTSALRREVSPADRSPSSSVLPQISTSTSACLATNTTYNKIGIHYNHNHNYNNTLHQSPPQPNINMHGSNCPKCGASSDGGKSCSSCGAVCSSRPCEVITTASAAETGNHGSYLLI